ncbi:MAG TPA: hypothetical protein VF796_22835 [Humisphaera sp.]
MSIAVLLLAASSVPLNAPAAVAAVPPAAVLAAEAELTDEKAKAAAVAFVKEKKLDWGEPLRVERRENEKDVWVVFPTSDNEVKLLHCRTIIVSPDGKARFLPRR